ncbi:MAG: glycoside hydrolase, family 3 domain protein [Nocardioides sp.]|nr:glycoside hydrolase, family 3 domain protein [Nocardioides sp.]
MNPERMALQVLLPAFPGTTLTADAAALLEEGLGGVCLFGSNTADGPDALRALTGAIHTAAPDAIVAVDEEGGDVTRLHAGSGSPVLGPAALGQADDLELTRTTGCLVGADLVEAGVDLDLGPVADVNTDPDNPVIGTRSFGTDPVRVAAHVAAWLSGLQGAGVAACAKHFPGHGDTAQDSHLELPTVDADLDLLLARELVPFVAAVDAGVAAVMTSHIVLPALDAGLPATLSRPVIALLRERLGFDGVIVSDALDMAGASGGRGIPEAAVLSLVAGADLLCLGADKDVDLVRGVQSAILTAVRTGRLPEERLSDAARRVSALRRPPDGGRASLDGAGLLAGARRSVTVDGVVPSLAGAVVVRVDTPANIAVGDVPWGLPSDVVIPGTASGTPADVPRDRPLVVQVRDAHRRPEALSLLDRLAGTGQPIVVVEWGWPGPHDARLPRICARGYSRPGATAVTELLRRAGWDR